MSSVAAPPPPAAPAPPDAAPAAAASSSAPPSSKKRKIDEDEPLPNSSLASDLQVLHQSTELSLLYLRHPQSSWHAQGRTSLYVINDVPGDFAMHLRGSCNVLDVTVEALQQTTTTSTAESVPMDVDDGAAAPPSNNKHVSLVSIPVSYQHCDPLAHVLVKPVQGNDDEPNGQYDADSQWVRGAAGMTLGLRAASIASNMGELRISPNVEQQTSSTLEEEQQHVSKDDVMNFWMNDLRDSNGNKDGVVAEELTDKLYERSTRAREARIKLVAQQLEEASSSQKDDSKDDDKTKVVKVTIVYEVVLDRMAHLGGIHSIHGQSPHVYTTTGVLGDHEGPRSWIPCLDSASSKHRASHEIVVKATAPMREGLSVVGCGQDFGVSMSCLHDIILPANAAEQLGTFHVKMLSDTVRKAMSDNAQESQEGSAPHVIPPDPSSVDSILATTIWASQLWTPTPIRSLGFTVGPFKVLEDPDYFSEENDDDDDEDEAEDAEEMDQSAFVEAARENGEGIRQVYFAPLYERKYIHLSADMSLLHQTTLELPHLGARFVEMSRDLDQAVLASTVGVPLRALSLFRDIMALPTYRTSSYTQIWIPDAVHGGSTSGALHCCPEVLVNPFIGGSIMDARLLSPVGARLPYYNGGRVLQLIQARCVVRGWITAALPLGEGDDVGFGYLYTLIESFLMSIYERGHGAFGEGGAKNGVFFTKRYATKSGVNSSALDFLPVANIEEAELDAVVGGLLPIEDRNSDQLWRTASNGTESHTSALDELGVRQVLYKDSVEALERLTDRKNNVPLPSSGYLGSHFSLSFLSTNASSSSELGCGALELLHPIGGMTYRALKCEILRRVVEGRAGIATFVRLIRAAFIAAHLEDSGRKELKDEDWQKKAKQKKVSEKSKAEEKEHASDQGQRMRPPFLLCVDELLKKHGLTHALFTRALRILAGPTREQHLRGTLVDVERETRMPGNGRHFVEPESFPNAYVRGASELYLRVGAHVEPAGTADGGLASSSATAKGTHLQLLSEPVIPHGGIAFGGPVTVRVVENEGQLREFVRSMAADGSRCDWGPIFLHAKPVTTTRQQNAASGGIEGGRGNKKSDDGDASKIGSTPSGDMNSASDAVFSDSLLHNGGYQALELVRLTNKTPLLWVRVDPMGIYGGRVAVVQPDACIAEQLFHDGDAGAQVDAIRALAERPFRIQGSVKITAVYGADVSDLPVRVLGDCLRGSVALHSSLPHTPAVRVQSAYAIAQWQNNRETVNKVPGKTDSWLGLNILMQYFRERFYDNGSIVPVSFTRIVLKKSEDHLGQSSNDAGVGTSKTGDDALYQYLDTFETPEERRLAIKEAADIEIEEDEEYRVRSAVVQAIASIRLEDGTTPPAVLSFLEEVLVSGNSSMVGSSVSGEADIDQHKLTEKDAIDLKKRGLSRDDKIAALKFVPSIMVADALLALCSVNASIALITDPATGKVIHSGAGTAHPSLPLIAASHRWLEWELYRETIRAEAEETTLTGVGGGTYSTVSACAVTALCSLCILKQSTTDPEPEAIVVDKQTGTFTERTSKLQSEDSVSDMASSAQYYKNIFDGEPLRNDVTRAACAQAVACICCAADRVEDDSRESVGLLSALEFLLERILDSRTSPGLRQTLALLMMDACTGKICSTQRVAVVGGRGDLCTSAARLLTGPLGASYGGDNGSAILVSVSDILYPAANAVNDGARHGLGLLKTAGGAKDETTSNKTIARIAKFATSLWRAINGDDAPPPSAIMPRVSKDPYGICAFDGQLRCSLLSLWQWIWPLPCNAVLRVQAWERLMGKEQYKQLGGDLIMCSTTEVNAAANEEQKSLATINHIVEKEIDRQKWRGELASKAFEYHLYDKSKKEGSEAAVTLDAEIGQPLPMVKRDAPFQRGGWVASAAQQRRVDRLDGGCKVTAVRIKMKSSSGAE